MRKILTMGILVLGSLVAVQAQATTVSAPILEFLEIEGAAAQKIVAIEQELRDLQTLATEIQQLQVFAKNLKRASPKLWDSSLNLFENLSGATDTIDMYFNAGTDFGGVLKRSGCVSGAIDAGPRPGLTAYSRPGEDNYLTQAASSPEQLDRLRLRSKCRQLALTAMSKENTAKQADTSKKDAENFKDDKTVGANAAADMMVKQAMETKALLMQTAEGQLTLAQEKLELEMAESEQQRKMHDRLMKAPSSARQMKPRNPTLTVDPRNY